MIRENLPQETLKAVLAIYDDLDMGTDSLIFRVDQQDNVKVLILCSDTFAYACADAHEITDENFPLFLETAQGLLQFSQEDEYAECDLEVVFVGIDRQMPPIEPVIKSLSASARDYLNAQLAFGKLTED